VYKIQVLQHVVLLPLLHRFCKPIQLLQLFRS